MNTLTAEAPAPNPALAQAPLSALKRAERSALDRLLALQKKAGDWEGEMVWCTMILAQTVIVRTIVGRPYTPTEQHHIVRHFAHYQRADGSWGMHPESEGYVFFTALAYVALRVLGLAPSQPLLAKARLWLQSQPDGVKGIPTWGKFWLALLGLYDYAGLNAVPPELFILPEWLPFHPRRFYCHTRLIYLGMAYLSGRRFVARLPGTLREELRAELYPEGYAAVDFAGLRHRLAATDVYVPISPLLRRIYDLLAWYERRPLAGLRRRALRSCFERILQEQRLTAYQAISPVNGLLNCLAIHAVDPAHPDLAPSLDGVEAWRWEDEAEGIRYVGARSNSWDTAFVLQALAASERPPAAAVAAAGRALAFLDRAQATEDLPDDRSAWRDGLRGGWCFSDGRHRWPVSDCTAEALSAILELTEHPDFRALRSLSNERLEAAVEFILSRQNADGGFGTYERRRGGRFLETINPSEMFGQCMTELSYVECTASAVSALSHFRRRFPKHDTPGIARAVERALHFLRRSQAADGSYPGFWGINYTYAGFHVARALRHAGVPMTDPCLQALGTWLLGKQRPDGGWGEHHRSCLEGRYVEHPESQVVMTSWAVLALLEILPASHPAIAAGITWLIGRQLPNGDWPQQSVNGVFFGAAMLDYRLYHNYFPSWALALYRRRLRALDPTVDPVRVEVVGR